MIRLFIYWEFEKPSQVLYLLFGLIVLTLSLFKLSSYIISFFDFNMNYKHLIALALCLLLLWFSKKLLLSLFDILEQRWQVDYKWELIAIFLVFAVTGTSSVTLGKPLLRIIGITIENLPSWFYYPIFILTSFVLYQILLVSFGWLFGQFTFFWNMEKKLLRRLGLNF